MTTTTTEPVFQKGDTVRLKPGNGDLGTYKVMRAEPRADGSILVYGGDADPGGWRSYRDFKQSSLMAENRKGTLQKVKRASKGATDE